jgi:hypothetical protein
MKILILLIALTMISCNSAKDKAQNKESGTKIPDSRVIIYKTKADYYYNVPISISEDKTQITSYPHPKDLSSGSHLRLPDSLSKGFLLDNRGIGKNTVFLKISYKDYSEMQSTMSLDDMKAMIIDYDPITEMYDCGYGYQYDNPKQEIDQLIQDNDFSRFKRVK